MENSHPKLHPKVVGFILYCTRENRDWPRLYDEMCRVAGQGLYEGLHHRDLKNMGLSLSLTALGTTVEIIESVTRSPLKSGPFRN